MSITPSIRTVKKVPKNMSAISESGKISIKTEPELKLSHYSEKFKQEDNKQNKKEKSIINRLNPIENKSNHSHENITRNTDKKITASYLKQNKENNVEKVIRGEKLPPPVNYVNPMYDNDGHKTIICWNCDTILLIGDDWDIVQCTNCDKLNKVSDEVEGGNSAYQNKFNNKLNHFETNIPYIFVIVFCPYCGKQNKAHKGTQHLVCYKCNHSFNIESLSPSGNKTKFHTGGSTLSSYNSNTIKFSDIMTYNNMIPAISQHQYVYPNNSNMFYHQMPMNPSDYVKNGYYNPYFNAYYPNVYPAPIFHNYLYDPIPNKNHMLDYYLRPRIKKNYPNNYINKNNPYEDKETKSQIMKLKENLAKINEDLGIEDKKDTHGNKGTLIKNVSEFKDKIESNKISKNEAVYKSLIMR